MLHRMKPCHCGSPVSVSVPATCPCAQDRLPSQPPLLIHACLAPPQGLTAQGAPPRHGDSGGAPGWTTPQVPCLDPSVLLLTLPSTSSSLSCLVMSGPLTCAWFSVLCMDILLKPAWDGPSGKGGTQARACGWEMLRGTSFLTMGLLPPNSEPSIGAPGLFRVLLWRLALTLTCFFLSLRL